MATMKALVKTAPGAHTIELVDWPVPEPGPDDVLMKVSFCGICGSDLHHWDGSKYSEPPLVLGHEYSGVAAVVGRNVTHVSEGDPICYVRGPRKGWPGIRGDGAFAEYMLVDGGSIMRTPPGISQEAACQFEAIQVPYRNIRLLARMEPGEEVIISGPGPIGLLTTNVAKLDGASHITVIGAPGDERERLPKACELGADLTIVDDGNLDAHFAEHPAPPLWLETSGYPAAVEASVRHVAPNGRIVMSGMGHGPYAPDMSRVATDNITIYGTWGGTSEFMDEIYELIRSGALRIADTISHIIPLSDWRRGFEMLLKREGLKILIDPSR
jgi:threonine dehydrogenase-like Zn-dependent dehydrogenase